LEQQQQQQHADTLGDLLSCVALGKLCAQNGAWITALLGVLLDALQPAFLCLLKHAARVVWTLVE
jgi:hypothetical protein